MKWTTVWGIAWIAMGSLAWMLVGASPGQTGAPAEPSSPPSTATAPAGAPGVVATVGEMNVTEQDIQAILDTVSHKLSKDKRIEMWNSFLSQLIYANLLHAYLEAHQIPEAPEELNLIREQLAQRVERHNQTAGILRKSTLTLYELMESRGFNEQRLSDQARYQKLLDSETTNEKLLAFIDEHPDYFNETKIQAGHIFLPCAPLARTEEQQAVLRRFQTIVADLQAGKITFAQAAQKYSQAPSGQVQGPEGNTDYGDMGLATFPQIALGMGVPAAVTVFDTPVGQLSPVVRSGMGFHLFQVTRRVPGDTPPGPQASQLARMIVQNRLQNQILNQSLRGSPIEIYKIKGQPKEPTQ